MSKQEIYKTPETPPPVDVAQEIADEMLKAPNLVAEQLAVGYRKIWNKLYNPPAGVTTNEIFEKMGPAGAAFVEEARAMIVFLEQRIGEKRPDLIQGIRARYTMQPESIVDEETGKVTLAETWPKNNV